MKRQEYERRRDGPLIDYVKDERGLITRTERDSYRNVVLVEHPDGGIERWGYQAGTSFITEHTDEAQVRSTYAYDSRGNLTKTTQAIDTPLERVIEMTYDSVGRMRTRTQKGASVADDAVTTYGYDNYGNVTKITDAENQVAEMTYNVLGNVLSRKDARLHTSTMTYTPGGWLETSSTNLGFISRMTYDKTGNRESSVTPIDSTATATTLYRYDDLDRLKETVDPLDGISKQRYDEEGRLFESEDARQVLTKLEYDGTSRMIKMIDGNQNATETVYGDAINALEGLVAKRIYPTYTETYKYDQRDRQVEITQVLSPTKSYVSSMSYDGVGQVISQTDAKGRTSQRFYDKLRRLTKEIDPILGETIYTYDVRDNLLTVTDANGHTHTFTYDKVNRKKTEARPMGQTIRYQYDANGNLIERLSPNSAKRTFRYDDDNRLELEQHFLPKTTAPSKTMSYTYDQRGLLKSYSDGLTSGVYIYDAKGQKTSEAIAFGTGPSAFTKTITRTYEANGLAKSMTYPGSTGTLNYTYDTNNQLKTYKIPGLAANNDTLTYQYRWNAIKEITMPGNLKRVVTLDALQRPERIEVKGYGATPGNNGEPVMDHRYIYDEVSNISKKTTLDGDYVYSYDRLDRLTDAAPPAGLQQSASNTTGLPIERYSYDNVHNRLTSLHQPGPWIYNENNELTAWGSAATKHAITYDLNGSTIKDEIGAPVLSKTTEYVYDAQDRMVEVKDNSVTVAKYAYDPMGRRIWRQAGAEITWFLYSDEGLIEELTASNTSIRTYGWNPGGMWGTDTVWQKDTNGVFLSNNDHLYTTDVLTSVLAGNKGWSGIRESFGKTTVQAGSSTSYLMRFPGQWEDGVAGFNQNYLRDYLQLTGRFSEQDPASIGGGMAFYAYGRADPINRLDSMGLRYSDVNCSLLSDWIDVQWRTYWAYFGMSQTGKPFPRQTLASSASECSGQYQDEGRRLSCEAHENAHSSLVGFYLVIILPFKGPEYYYKRLAHEELKATEVGIKTGEKLYKENCFKNCPYGYSR